MTINRRLPSIQPYALPVEGEWPASRADWTLEPGRAALLIHEAIGDQLTCVFVDHGLLRAGEASFHHGHLFHASGPNTTPARRVGVAIRYIAPSMKQTSGHKLLVSHVAGEDRYGHFEHMPAPAGRMQAADWEYARRNVAMKKEILYRGVKPELVKVNRRA